MEKPIDLLLKVHVRQKNRKGWNSKSRDFCVCSFLTNNWNVKLELDNWKRSVMRLPLNCSLPKVVDDKGNK